MEGRIATPQSLAVSATEAVREPTFKRDLQVAELARIWELQRNLKRQWKVESQPAQSLAASATERVVVPEIHLFGGGTPPLRLAAAATDRGHRAVT